MENSGEAIIQLSGTFHQDSTKVLTLLYYPIIGKDAFILYQLLYSLEDLSIGVNQIIELSNLNDGTYQKARETLEEFGLLKTFLNTSENRWLYFVCPPLDSTSFFSHDSYARIFINECGARQYDYLKAYFHVDEMKTDGYLDVSKPLDTSRLDLWNDKKEEVFQNNKANEQRVYDFDFNVFLQGMDRIFPIRLRTPENLSFIAQLSSIYGIDERDMKRLVQRSIHPSTKEFDKDLLKELVFVSRKNVKASKDPYKMGPVAFFKSKQNGAPVSNSDKHLLESLCVDYGFTNEVVNVLIEYCLDKTNQSFNHSYVEKVASSWARLKIDTKEKALNQINKVPTRKKAPEWYENTEQTKPSQQSLQEALKLQEKLKGSEG
ncbi:MAG: DnaD domain protein [Erysipelotrichaceae bacterium]|uniref:DnaD domain protein n=1 Tax=Floccifex sp. TaxID=2815810 RepID=UPI0029FEEE0A|nr:DnaD domain protein [Floccifex sp.]MDD7280416.1 DnaD domain protein [Erysipelotrichaceae bacterium]MDY2957582.1 DnaD domain protein [Floccifex sp.]